MLELVMCGSTDEFEELLQQYFNFSIQNLKLGKMAERCVEIPMEKV